MKNRRVTEYVLVLAAALVLSACGLDSGPGVTVEMGSSYPIDSSPQGVVASASNNAAILRVTVKEVEGPVEYRLSDGTVFAFVPVSVTVDEVIKGSAAIGEQIWVRVLGGDVGQTSYVVRDGIAPESFQPGQSLIVFTQEEVTLGDISASTVNAAYEVNSSQASDLGTSGARVAEESLINDVRAALSRPAGSVGDQDGVTTTTTG